MKPGMIALFCAACVFSSDVECQSQEKDILEAIKAEDTAKIESLVKANPQAANKDVPSYGPPLLFAIDQKKFKAVSAMLAAGASPNVKNTDGENAFHRLARVGVLKKGDLDAVVGAVKMLKEKNCDINMFSKSGYTPLHALLTTYVGAKKIDDSKALVEAFLQHGADIKLHLKDQNKTPILMETIARLKYVPGKKPGEEVQGEELFEFMKILMEKGYDVNAQDSNKSTALIELMKKKLPDDMKTGMVKYLLEKKADPKIKNKKKECAIDLADKKSQLYEMLKNPPK